MQLKIRNYYPLLSHLSFILYASFLELSRPDRLEDALFSGKTTEGVVSFRGETDSTGDGEGDGFTSVATFRVDFSNV